MNSSTVTCQMSLSAHTPTPTSLIVYLICLLIFTSSVLIDRLLDRLNGASKEIGVAHLGVEVSSVRCGMLCLEPWPSRRSLLYRIRCYGVDGLMWESEGFGRPVIFRTKEVYRVPSDEYACGEKSDR